LHQVERIQDYTLPLGYESWAEFFGHVGGV